MNATRLRLAGTMAIAMLVLPASLVASRSNVIGSLTGIDSNGIVSGWAQDLSNPSASIYVHLYLDGPAGGGGAFLTVFTASMPRSEPGSGPHGFRFPIPAQLRDSAPHTLYAYGIGYSGIPGDNALLPGSPQTFTLAPTVLRLQSGAMQFGVEPRCGGTLVEMSLNGENFVNNFDCTGRQVQVGLYDGNAAYDSCAGCQGVWGWDPVQGGDRHNFGSPLLSQTVTSDLIYTATQPYEWYPDNKGGGPGEPILSDVTIEQTASFVPGNPYAVRLHYKITHFGSDSHGYAIQEFPAVYVNREYDTLVSYSGTAPWTGDSVTLDRLTLPDQDAPQRYVSEHWAALVNSEGVGLTVYMPQQYPYIQGLQLDGPTGTHGWGANYFRPHVPFAFGPGAILEADVYVIAGDYRQARQTIEGLHAAGPTPDVLPPYGWLDAPSTGQSLSRTVSVGGWAFDNEQVSRIEVVMDGTVAGTATYGLARPDIGNWFPQAVQVGFSYALDTRRYANGQHQIQVRALDKAGNVAILGDWPVVISNSLAIDGTAPSVAISSITSSGFNSLTIAVKASDAVGVTRVELYVDGQLLGNDSRSPYSFAIARTSLSRGTHRFVAKAYDAAGNVGVSAPVNWVKN